MVDQLRHLAVGLDQALAELIRVAGGEAQALDARDLRGVFQQQGQVGVLARVAHLAAVGIDVLAQQIELHHALVGQAGDLGQHIVEGARDLFAAGIGHDAVAAVLGAAFHDGNEG